MKKSKALTINSYLRLTGIQLLLRKTVFKFILIMIIILAIIPLFGGDYLLHILILSFTLGIFSASWDLVFGYAGQLNFGIALPFGVAGYITAFAVMFYNVPSWVALFIGVAVSTVICTGVALPALRLKGVYLAIVTLAAAQIGWLTVSRLWGDEGINPAAIFHIYGYYPKVESLVQGIQGHYYLALTFMIISCSIMYWITKSQLGIKFMAIRDDEVAARAIGINVTLYKILAFSISSMFAGIAGSFYTLYVMHADPWYLSLDLTFRGISMTIFGGLGTIIGPVTGALCLTFATEYLRPIGYFRLVIYGLVMVLVILFMPKGVIRKIEFLFRKSINGM